MFSVMLTRDQITKLLEDALRNDDTATMKYLDSILGVIDAEELRQFDLANPVED